jgi:hypothetical protein
MRSIPRAAVPLALAAGLVAAAPAAADAKPAPEARASGSAPVVVVYPSVVQVRINRAERALERATKRIENGDVTKAASSLKVVRRQTAAAWRGAKYVIRTAPPPVPPEDLRMRARASQDDATGPTYASPAESAFAVLTLQHDVSTAVVQLIDGSHGAGLTALSRTLYLTLDRRDRAITDIKALAPPPPPPEDLRGRARARASQDEEAPVGFETVMPNTIGQFDDETQAIEATKSDATDLTAGGRRLLNAAGVQVAATKNAVNATWPPVVPED